MTILFNDFETYSRADLKKVGNHRYARDPSTRALMLAYAFDKEAVQQWVPAEGQPMPRDLKDALRDPSVTKSAWNAPMEMCTWKYVLGEDIYFDEWRCSMVMALSLSFPGSLAAVGPIVDLPSDKQKDAEGKRLITRFCKPKRKTKKDPFTRCNYLTHPEEWELFKQYNIQDVEAERAIYYRVKKWDLPDWEWDLWAIDQDINWGGIPINMDVVRNAIRFVEYIREKRYAEMRELSEGEIENPRSRPQVLEWLRTEGYRFEDMKKGHVQQAANDKKMSPEVRRMCELRLETSKTSTDKFYAMQRAAIDDQKVCGAFQFAGAGRTWRWSGRIFQPQNLARPHPELEDLQEQCVTHLEKLEPESLELLYDNQDPDKAGTMDFLSTCIRPTIQAPKGKVIISADLNAIENRVLGWLADDQKILNVFRKDRDPYIDFAQYLYDSSYEDEWEMYKPESGEKGDKAHRTIAKPGVLGCGYMLSAGEQRENRKTGEIEATGLLGYAWNMGVKSFTLEDAKRSVKVWRETFEGAVDYWWEIEKAAKRCIRRGKETSAGPIGFDRSGPFMRMILPSGRCLHYCRPRLEEVVLTFCREKRRYLPVGLCLDPDPKRTRTKESITYEGLDDRNKWTRINTHPGKLTENADQAVSRDLLAHGMKLARKEGIWIPVHVHDELVGITAEKRAQEDLQILIECMSEQPKWAKGLPLKAAGTIGRVWIKD